MPTQRSTPIRPSGKPMAHRHGEPTDNHGTSGSEPEEPVGGSGVVERRPRGPYRIADASTGSREGDLLRDPQVAAFLDALRRIRDPQRRAIVMELLRDLAQQRNADSR